MPGHGEKRPSNKVKALSAHLRERQEKIQQTLECLAEESVRGTPIIVEGKNDVETLRTLGVQGRIVTAKTGGKSRLDLISEIEKIGSQEVILLLDFDRRGREWTAILRQNLEKAGIKANVTFRIELLRFAGRELKDIEGLAAYLQTLSRKLNET
ncbi:MAG TPA: toprim domain-containing protein [candidate division Zixibacteria bacterium]|nr:toprim domain-containing protein [candidate division Zixibacteria bacterium]